MEAQSLEGTWNEINYYVTSEFRIVTDVYCENLGIEHAEKLRDVDREIIHEIKYQLKTPPTACYPIYFISVGDDTEERLVYPSFSQEESVNKPELRTWIHFALCYFTCQRNLFRCFSNLSLA